MCIYLLLIALFFYACMYVYICISSIVFSTEVFEQLGVAHLYLVYLVGGFIATAPSFIYDKVSGRLSLLGSELVQHFSDKLRVPAHLSAPVASLTGKAGAFISKMLPTLYIGSSGAVSSLMGCNAVVSVYRASNAFYRLFFDRLSFTETKQIFQGLLFSGCSLYNSLSLINSEIKLIDPVHFIDQESSLYEKVVKIFNVSGINHAAHVQGYYFGACYGFTVLFGPIIYRKCKDWWEDSRSK